MSEEKEISKITLELETLAKLKLRKRITDEVFKKYWKSLTKEIWELLKIERE